MANPFQQQQSSLAAALSGATKATATNAGFIDVTVSPVAGGGSVATTHYYGGGGGGYTSTQSYGGNVGTILATPSGVQGIQSSAVSQLPSSSILTGITPSQISQQSAAQKLMGSSASQNALAQQLQAQAQQAQIGSSVGFIPLPNVSYAQRVTAQDSSIQPKTQTQVDYYLKNLTSGGSNRITAVEEPTYLQNVKDYGIFSGSLKYLGEKSKGLINKQKIGSEGYTPLEMKGTGTYDIKSRQFNPTLTPGSPTIAQREATKTAITKEAASSFVQTAPYFAPFGIGTGLLIATGAEQLLYPKSRVELETTATNLGLPKELGYVLPISQIAFSGLEASRIAGEIVPSRIAKAVGAEYERLGAGNTRFIQSIRGESFNIVGKQTGNGIRRTFVGEGNIGKELSSGLIGSYTIGKVTYKNILGKTTTRGILGIDISEAGTKVLPKTVRQLGGGTTYSIVKGGEYPLLSTFTIFKQGEPLSRISKRLGESIIYPSGKHITITESLSQPSTIEGITKIRSPGVKGMEIKIPEASKSNIITPAEIKKTPLSKTFGEQKEITQITIPSTETKLIKPQQINLPIQRPISPLVEETPKSSLASGKIISSTLKKESVISSMIKPISISRVISGEKSIEKINIAQGNIPSNILSQPTITKQQQRAQQLTLQTPSSAQQERQIEKLRLNQLEEAQMQPQLSRESILNTGIFKEGENKKRLLFGLWGSRTSYNKELRKQDKSKRFLSIVKRFGKERILGSYPTPEQAQTRGLLDNLSTLSRTTRVREAETGKQVSLLNPNTALFRQGKKNRLDIIQINPLSTKSETREIQAARRNSGNRFKSTKQFTKLSKRFKKARL